MKSTEERLKSIEDDLAVRNLVARFAHMTTTADYEGFNTLWSSEGVFTISEPANQTRTGAEDITEFIIQLRDERDFFVQFVHSGVTEIRGNEGTGKWIMQEVAQGPGEKYYNNYGVFEDRYENTDGTWLFSSRVYHYMWLDTGKFVGKPVDLPKNL